MQLVSTINILCQTATSNFYGWRIDLLYQVFMAFTSDPKEPISETCC